LSLTRARELAVLAALSAHGAHGYSIAAAFEGSFGPFLGINRAAIYAILGRFDRRGWISGSVKRGGSHPDREVFRITKAGREAFAELGNQLEDNPGLPQSPLLALLMASEVTGDRVDRDVLIEKRKSALAALEKSAGADHSDSPSLQLCKRLLQAELGALRSLK
jgi:DNA-binding PadR family transcriptional regulator